MNSHQDGRPPYPLSVIVTGTPITIPEGTQISQIGRARVAGRRDHTRRAERRLCALRLKSRTEHEP